MAVAIENDRVAHPRNLSGWSQYLFMQILFAGSPSHDTPIRKFSLILVLLLPAIILYPTLGFHLLEPDEGRYAQIPREMLERGEWVVPTLQGEPYLDKPPLMYWLVGLSYRAFGISPESARLVPAISIHLTILAVYCLGRRSLGERAALWAALLLSVAPGFVSIARLLLLDGLLVLCVTVSVLCGFEAVRTARLKLSWWIAAACASGFGFLTKGPISELLLFVPLWAYSFLARPARENATGLLSWAVARWHHYLLFFSIVFAVNLPWYVAIYLREPAFLKHFFWEHNVLRFVQPFDHLKPVWYYAPILLIGLLPGTLFFAAYLWNLTTTGEDGSRSRSLSSGFWLLAGSWCIFFFSCSGSKLPTYILPAYPFLCLALGEFIARSSWDKLLTTRVAIGGMGVVVLLLHHVGVPIYARERSPFGHPELVEGFVADRDIQVVCFPRNCDSVAYYVGRDDFDRIRTRETNKLIHDCHHRDKTVILFTHEDALPGFRSVLPASLEIVETQSLQRRYSMTLANTLFGRTPWGLCDIAVVVPKGNPGRVGTLHSTAQR